MTRLLGVVLATAILFGVCVAAIEAGHDRATVVPPPDAVAEAFTREILTKRWARAKEYLQQPESMSEDEMRDLQQRIESRVIEVSEVEAEIVSEDEESALATVRVSSSHGSDVLAFRLVFEKEWKIAMQ